MKKLNTKYTVAVCLALVFSFGCKKTFLDKYPYGPVSPVTLADKAGVEALLIGAYSSLDGITTVFGFERAISNWHFGGVASDDAHKGSDSGDQNELNAIESYTANSGNGYFRGKWNALYIGIQRANEVIRLLPKLNSDALSEADATEILAEARFIRAILHFEAAKMWKNVPYVDENVSFETGNYFISNEVPIYPKIEADLQFAAEHLNATQVQFGRANKWAAKAFLGKVYMFELKFAEAKAVLTDVIANGVNSAGVKYALVNYSDNFNALKQNNAETVFAVQMSVGDGSFRNGNAADILNFPVGGPTGCCGFYQPSFSLVNSFKTDPVTGLPLLDTWNNTDLKNDMGLSGNDPFTPTTETVDPRLDWTVGRRGIPYLDWGIMPGQPWVKLQSFGGPYIPIKNIYYKANQATTSETYDGWAAGQSTSNNYNMMRFADVLLLAAEAEIEVGNLSTAESYVNQVRARAARPEGFVHKYIDNNNTTGGYTTAPAANYKINLYPSGTFAAQGQEFARKATRFERKIEFGMEGHRFFDLQRWDKASPGYMANVLNAYIKHETTTYNYETLKGATFTQGKNELYPIPQYDIDNSVNASGVKTLKQNPGY